MADVQVAQPGRLIFSRLVKEVFDDFLVGYGFKPTTITDINIHYESGKVYLIFCYEPYDWGIFLEMGLLASPHHRQELGTMLNAVLGDKHGLIVYYQANTESVMRSCLQKLLECLKNHCEPFLQGDEKMYLTAETIHQKP